MTPLEETRRFYARLLAVQAGSSDPRLEEIFAAVPREDFLGPGPWTMIAGGRPIETPSADPIHVYRNLLVVLDAEKGINNGEPLLHAMWMAKAMPRPGETVAHIGAGAGYYTALLSRLVEPGGSVVAFEREAGLAASARRNLVPYTAAAIVEGDAVTADLPPSDIVYVNAGVVAPPLRWLKALKPGGRLLFPWRPAERVGLAVMVTRTADGFAADPFMHSWFIACVGASDAIPGARLPDARRAAETRSLWLASEKAPDDTATAVFGDIWFSARRLTG